MKKYFLVWELFICFSGLACTAGYVAKRPADVRYARPVSPGHGYIWVTGEWQWRGGKYYWKEGYWQVARPGRTWKPGYWESSQKGYKWHKGYWQ
jgi:hypothetical protein